MKNMKKSIVLLSGGLDSTTCLALARSKGERCFVLSFNYGQKHKVELERAKQIAAHFKAEEHKIVELPVSIFLGSALTDPSLAVPVHQDLTKIPITYVPARNTIFLAIALGWSEVLKADTIYYGANALDYSNYPDCRPQFLAAFQKMADLATQCGIEGPGIKIEAPLIDLTKAEIIRLGLSLEIDYSLTISCYNPDVQGRACGQCDSCFLRIKGFRECNVADPTPYR
jgi:7-cyano-7-deazaguanine synthase